jgi:Ca2+-binding EF-hand superfamily protein
MKKVLLLGAAVLTLNAIPAFAEEGAKKHNGGMKMEKMFAEQDTDSNGTVSKDEFVAHATKRFESMDANKDGGVTQAEIKAHFDAKRAEWKAKKEAAAKAATPPAEKPAE